MLSSTYMLKYEFSSNVELARRGAPKSRFPKVPTPHFSDLKETPANRGSCAYCSTVTAIGVKPV